MAHAPAKPAETTAITGRAAMARPTVQAPPVTPGKVAMWLFLATEIMFFTGLIGSYVVLRSGSPPTAYSRLYAPATDLTPFRDKKAVVLEAVGPNAEKVHEIVKEATGMGERETEHALDWGTLVVKANLADAEAKTLSERLVDAGATVSVRGLEGAGPNVEAKAETSGGASNPGLAEKQESNVFNWPQPYDSLTNPLSINLTALNTFFLICSSVTMVLALAAIQRGEQGRGTAFLGLTVLIGALFLSIQVIEYTKLGLTEHYPIGISATGHFRPSVSLFASCFYTMTGFHGAHVAGGVVLLSCIFIQSLRGAYTRENHSPVELAGLYWHFVDLVWIILFTVVYLV